MSTVPFTPGQTQEIILATTSSSLALNADAPQIYVLLNSSAADALAFIRIGTGAQTAVASDFAVPPNIPMILTKGVGANTIAAMANAPGVGGLLFVTTGVGR
jgi:hypothetical protein